MAITPYDRITNFQDQQATAPTEPYPSEDFDAEYNAIKITTDEIIGNLGLIQRDDGELANGSVGRDQLDPEIVLGFSPPTQWETATSYTPPDTVFAANGFYYCEVPHTSTVFANDLAAGRWSLIADFAATTTGVREKLSTSRDYYVNAGVTGDDLNNNGRSPTTPFKTLQKAMLTVVGLDFGGFDVRINIADGTYGAGIAHSGELIGLTQYNQLHIIGNEAAPQNVIISVLDGECFSFGQAGFASLKVFLRGMELRTTTAGAPATNCNCISAWGDACVVEFSNIRFGNCTGAHISSQHKATVISTSANYVICGNAAIHGYAQSGGHLYVHGATITHTNNPNFSLGYWYLHVHGVLFAINMNYVNGNTVTGVRYNVGPGSYASTNGSPPGTAPGTVDYMGKYDGETVVNGPDIFFPTVAHTYTAPQGYPESPLTYAASGNTLWNPNLQPCATVVMAGGNSLIFISAAPTPGRVYTIRIQQAASGGPFSLAWGSSVKWAGGAAAVPVISPAANAVDRFTFIARTDTSLEEIGRAQGIA